MTSARPDEALGPWGGEEWLPVAGHEGLYEVSNLGRVKAVGYGKARRAGRHLKLKLGTTGYLYVCLSRANVSKTRKIHHMVAEAFIGARPPGAFVLHRDGNPHNNVPANLYYGDARQNINDAIRHGTWRPRQGSRVNTAKMTLDGVLRVRVSTQTSSILAKAYGVDPSTIRDIRSRRTWRHV